MQKNLLKTNSFTNNYQQLIHEINSFEDEFKTLSNSEVTEQVEFGAFQKLGDKSTKKQGAV